MNDSQRPFFVAGGTLGADAVCYVERRADRELYEGIMAGEFCYVLTARQMGKSSLMMRVGARLERDGNKVAHLDLTALGQNLSPEQWYGGLLLQLGQRLDLEQQLLDSWQARRYGGSLQNWIRTVYEVVLRAYHQRVVIFVDEIDMVRSLPFAADEFFAGIRECYNRRSASSSTARLCFSLLGVASPSDLVRDPRMTPFNIGRRIDLYDFTETEAQPLEKGLGHARKSSAALLQRILYWTHGHPYLTQRFCLEAAGNHQFQNTREVDRLCVELFLLPEAQERDHNLIFVRDCMLRSDGDLAGLLDLYRKVCSGKRVRDDGSSPLAGRLQLVGITRSEAGNLKIRNRIYGRVFTRRWINSSMPDPELRRQRAAYRKGLWRSALIASCILAVVGAFALLAVVQTRQAQGLLYDREMRLALDEWDNVDRVAELVEETRRHGPLQADLRGFEWGLFLQHVHSDLLDRPKEDHPISALALSPDGKSLAIAESRQAGKAEDRGYLLKLYDVAGRKMISSKEIPADISFGLVALSSDGLHVTVADPYLSDGTVTATTWDLKSGRAVTTFRGHQRELSLLALSPDNSTLVTADMGGTLEFWDAKTGVARVIRKHALGLSRWGSFSTDGKYLITADESQRVRLWKMETGAEQPAFVSDQGVTAAAFFPDGRRLLMARTDGSLQIWDISKRQPVTTLMGHTAEIQSVAFSPDGRTFATGSIDRTVRIWPTTGGSASRVIRGHGSAVISVAWSPDSQYLLSASTDRSFKLWDLKKEPDPVLPSDVTQYLATAFCRKELLAVGVGEDRSLRLLNLSSGKEIARLGATQREEVLTAAFSPDRSMLAIAGTSAVISLLDTTTGSIRRTLTGHTSYVYSLAFAPDGTKLISGGKDQTVRLWNLSTGNEIGQLKSRLPNSWRGAFSPDGRYVASAADDGDVELWDTTTRSVLRTFKGHLATVKAIAFSPDGKRLATGGDDNAVKLWDVDSGKEVKQLGLADHVQHAAFSPDGKRLVTGGADGSVKLWDITTRQELMTLAVHTDEVTAVTFSDDGTSLSSCSLDGTVRLWQGTNFR